MENLVIVGSGIAGWTAAIYAARAGLEPLVISGIEMGGQLTQTSEVDNFPGFPKGILGRELVENCQKQAERFGAKYKEEKVEDLIKEKKGFKLRMMGGEKISCKSVIIATGASARWLGIPSEDKYRGRGVTVCATCDGALFKGKEVIVIGGGDSAMEEALFMTKFASSVTIVHRRGEFTASKIMQEKVKGNKKIKVIFNHTVEEVLGDGKKVSGALLRNVLDNSKKEIKCEGIFLAIGHTPNTDFCKNAVKVNEQGYIITDRMMHTSVGGVFAAGDVQDMRFRQAITAAGSGCMAAMEAEKWLRG